MAIKFHHPVTSETPEKHYPKLMINLGGKSIVLFTSLRTGTVVWQSNSTKGIGHYSTDWDIREFKDFEGSILLENE